MYMRHECMSSTLHRTAPHSREVLHQPEVPSKHKTQYWHSTAQVANEHLTASQATLDMVLKARTTGAA